MKKRSSLKRHEYLLLLISILISLFLIIISLNQIKKDSIKRIEASLITINTSCQEALKQWLNFRRYNIQELSENKFIIDKTIELLKLEPDSSVLVSSHHTTELREFFQPILHANEDLGVFLIAPDYISIFSMRNSNTGSFNLMAKDRKELLDKVLLEGETVLIPPIQSDVVLQSSYNSNTRHTMFLVTPVIYQNKIIAAFSLRIDTHKDFSRILELGRIGETGETYGYDKSNMMVTISRFENQLKESGQLKTNEGSIANLNIQNDEDPGSGANNNDDILSNKRVLTGMEDCRGQQVFAVRIWDEELNIGIITKIDKAEALKEFLLLRKILIITFLSIIVIGVLLIHIIVGLRQKTEDALTVNKERLEVLVSERTMELQHTIKTKDKFFSILAHDLRSPFSGFLGLFDLLLQDPEAVSETEKNNMMLQVYNSGSQLYKLLENLLYWSRAQTKNIKLNPEKLSVNELINENISLQDQYAKNKKIELLNEAEQGLYISADRNTTDTVLRNLISNAIKFTKEGGKVKIKASVNNKIVKIIVQDNGIGIPEENLHRLFKVEEKIFTLGTNDEKGTGLGLVLCKEFVELNQGKISVESKVNVGSTFIIELPSS